MAAVEKVLIVGAGLGGLALGIELRKHGIRVDTIEQQRTHNAAGIGIAQPGNALRALEKIGVKQLCISKGFQSDQYRYFDGAGQALASLQMLRIANTDLPAMNFLSRSALHESLLGAACEAGVNFRLGTTVESLRNNADGVSVKCSDGAVDTYDLVVGADGIRSQVRQQVFGASYEPIYTGCAAWRFLARRPEDLSYQAIYLGVGMRTGLVPISKESMFVFVVTNEPDAGRVQPDRFKAMLAERLASYTAPAMRDVAAQAEKAETIVYTPLEEVVMDVPWFKDRVVLMGDAAHASSPHVAQGAAMAFEDAVVLGEVLGKNMPVSAALDSYYIRRFGRCRYVQDYSRNIGKEGQLSDSKACADRNEALRKRFLVPQPRPHEWVLNENI